MTYSSRVREKRRGGTFASYHALLSWYHALQSCLIENQIIQALYVSNFIILGLTFLELQKRGVVALLL